MNEMINKMLPWGPFRNSEYRVFARQTEWKIERQAEATQDAVGRAHWLSLQLDDAELDHP